MTPRQRQLLDFIASYTDQHRYPPTYQEMCTALGLASKSNIARYLDSLEAQGFIARHPQRNRSVVILPAPPSQTRMVQS